MSLIDKMKKDVARSGSNKGKFIYLREGVKLRVRFLQEMDDGFEFPFHDSFELGINVPCQEVLMSRDCPYCDDEGIRTRSQYAWSVYDIEAKEVKILMFPVNNFSPVPQLLAMYENYGTIMDRDYVLSVNGKGTSKTYSVIPMDKAAFRNSKAKAYSETAAIKLLDKAWPCEGYDTDDDEDDEGTKSPKKSKSKKPKSKRPEPEETDEDDWGDEEESETRYDDKSPKELYELCQGRDIEAKPKKAAQYYIGLLVEQDESEGDFDDDDDDEWDDEDGDEIDYEELSVKELYDLCIERDIKVQPKKPAKYYIRLLEEQEEAEDDWED